MRLWAIVLIIWSIAGIASSRTGSAGQDEAISDEQQTLLAIRQLHSLDEAERRAAKDKLIRLGKPAIAALLPILKDVAEHPNGVPVIVDKENEKRQEEESLVK